MTVAPEPLPPPWAKPSGCEPSPWFRVIALPGVTLIPAFPPDPPEGGGQHP